MAFSLSGSTITQTGTDTSLAGLTGIAGVTTSQEAGRTIYNIGAGRNLVFNGTLTINASVEGIVSNSTTTLQHITFGSTANVLIRDYIEDASGNRLYFKNKWLTTLQENNQIQFSAGTTVKFYGGWTNIRRTLSHNEPIRFTGTAAVEFVQHAIGDTTQPFTGNSNQFRAFNSALVINGLELIRVIYTPGVVPAQLSGLKLIDMVGGIAPSGASPNTEMPFVDVQSFGSDTLFRMWQGKKLNFINAEKGTLHSVINHQQDAGAFGSALFTKNIKVKTSGMSNSVVYIRDQINANRVDGNGYTFSTDRVYINTTDGAGDTPIFNVLIGAVNSPTYNTIYNSAQVVSDVRFPSDVATVHVWNYGFAYSNFAANLRGNGTLNPVTSSLPDTNVSLTETNAVAKLASSFSVNTGTNTITVTANSTLDDLYDVMKAWKTTNVQAQLEYPTIATQPVTASGDALVTAMNVAGIEFLTTGTKFKKLQATCTASGAFSIEVIGTVNQATPTNLVATAKATTLVYNTNTPVSVNYATGATFNTVRNDGTGIVTISGGSITDYTDAQINYLDSSLTATGITSATIYQTQSDRDTGANAGATFTTSLNFKYGSVVGGVTMQNTVYLRVVVGSVTLFAQITLAIGSNTLDLGVQGQLSAIGAKVDLTAKQESLNIVNVGVQKASRFKTHSTNL